MSHEVYSEKEVKIENLAIAIATEIFNEAEGELRRTRIAERKNPTQEGKRTLLRLKGEYREARDNLYRLKVAAGKIPNGGR